MTTQNPIAAFVTGTVALTGCLVLAALHLQDVVFFRSSPEEVKADGRQVFYHLDLARARASGAFGPGRLPDILPDDATDIHEWREPVTQELQATFHAPSCPGSVRRRLEQMGARRVGSRGARGVETYELDDGSGPVSVRVGVSSDGQQVFLSRPRTAPR